MQELTAYQTHLSQNPLVWDTPQLQDHLLQQGLADNRRAVDRWLEKTNLLPNVLDTDQLRDETGSKLKPQVLDHLLTQAKKRRHSVLLLQLFTTADGHHGFLANDARQGRRWLWSEAAYTANSLIEALKALTLHAGKDTLFLPHGHCTSLARKIQRNNSPEQLATPCGQASLGLAAYPSQL
ncbi:MAG TPA: hypothetical protein EYQ12_02485, partial [Oceanospirillaceae bacterium]|nr:hypothetical protein [Oceanospirillaceae bacterium]